MKTLMLLRHAEAAHSTTGSDFDRPLADEGRHRMQFLAETVRRDGLVPDFIFCSPARRTRETLALLLPDTGRAPVAFEKTIYNATPGELYEQVKKAPARYEKVLVVGHNPATHDVATFLAGTADDKARLRELRMSFTPGTLAVLECPCEEWEQLQPGENRLAALYHGENIGLS